MNESTFWSNRVRVVLNVPTEGRVAWKVPAETHQGLPDVWFTIAGGGSIIRSVSGWLELKYVPAWPKRPGTPVRIAVTPNQREHLRLAQAGGAIGLVLLGVADEWFLIDPTAPLPAEGLTRAELTGSYPCVKAHGNRGSLGSLPYHLADAS